MYIDVYGSHPVFDATILAIDGFVKLHILAAGNHRQQAKS